MYSILIKKPESTYYSYYKTSSDEIYTASSLEVVQDKIVDLLDTYLLSQLVVVKNCIIEADVTVSEVEV